jgi:pyridoxal phosphate-dependent enzyme
VALFNRLTGATYATHLTLVKPGEVVIGVSSSYSHPSVVRAVAQAGARLVDTAGIDQFAAALERDAHVGLVVLTRLAVTYEIMSTEELRQVVHLAHAKGVRVYVDDAGGARVGPAIFDQPRTLQLGVDVVATGLDKYGTVGPRLGVMAGEKALVSRIRARPFEMGLEARPLLYPAAVRSLVGFTTERVQELVGTTHEVATAIKDILGDRLHETPVIAELLADDILAMVLERAGLRTAPMVPYEVVQVGEPRQKYPLAPVGMMKGFHHEQLPVNGVMRLIQEGAGHRHPGVFQHRIPAGFLLVKPAPHPLAIGCSGRGSDVLDKVAEPLTERHHAQALTLSHPVE